MLRTFKGNPGQTTGVYTDKNMQGSLRKTHSCVEVTANYTFDPQHGNYNTDYSNYNTDHRSESADHGMA